MVKFKYILVLCIVIALNGCLNYMALTKGQDNVDLSKKSIALLSVKISNQKVPSCQPHPSMIFFKGKNKKAYLIHSIDTFFKSEEPYKSVKDSFNEYLLSIDLDAGVNILEGISFEFKGGAVHKDTTYPFVHASGALLLNSEFNIKPNTVTYLGHINAVIRERKNDNEERAGSIIPLIDQRLAGFSNGTVDIVIEDKYDEDIKSYINEYPGLQKVKIEKSILPQWIRPEKQNIK